MEIYGIKPQILWQGSLKAEDINVEIQAKSNRKTNDDIEAELGKIWANAYVEAQRKGIELYNGTSYRLEKFNVRNGRLLFLVSPIKYCIRYGLHIYPGLARLGEDYYSHGLSVGGFVVTNDGKYLFARKSARTASTVKTDIIGGVLESIDPVSGMGILNQNICELKEEINVAVNNISDIKILGLVRSYTTDVIIISYTKLNLSANQVTDLFNARQNLELEGIDIVDRVNVADYLRALGGYKPELIKLLPF